MGIGTLYRHFPRRAALVEAVYEDQVERLSASARELLAQHPPAEAFRSWMTVFIDWAATKHEMTDTLRALMSSGRIEHSRMRAQLIAIVSLFLDAGVAAGDLRSDVGAADVAATLAGVLVVAGALDQRAQAARMLNLVLDGLRPGAPGDLPRLDHASAVRRPMNTPRSASRACRDNRVGGCPLGVRVLEGRDGDLFA